MDLFILEATVDGFKSGEVDLETRMNQDPAQGAFFIGTIIDNIVDALRSPNAGAALSVSGHSDRDDNTARSHIEKLAVELQAAEDRVSSAIDYIHTLVRQREPSAPADLNSLSFFDVHLRAPGAAVLVADEVSLTESRRRLNRRVQARLLVYKP